MLSLRPLKRSLRKQASQWRAWRTMAGRLGHYLRRHRRRLAVGLGFSLLYTTVGLLEPWTMKLILDSVLLGHPLPAFLAPVAPGPERPLVLLNVMVAVIIVLAGLRGLTYYYQKILIARVGQQVTAEIRLDFYRHLQRLCFSFHDRRRTGDILARLTTDVRLLREAFISLPLTLAGEVFLVVGMIVVMLFMDWGLTLLALTALPGLAVILRLYQRPMRSAIRRQREREGDIASIASEVLGAIKVVQGFRREESEVDRFSFENKRSLRTGLKAARLEAKLRWYAELTVAVVTALVIGVAARRVLEGALSPGELLVFVAYLRIFNRPLRRISRMAERAARGAVAAGRVFSMIDIEPTVTDAPGAVKVKRLRGEITYENVAFAYRRGPRILQNVNLTVRPGERVALTGATGAGKSTLLSLIPRFYDPEEGRVCLDGRDVREYRLGSLRDHVALVFQEPILFATTIAENIGYGRPGATMDDIVNAARDAGIHDIIASLPEGYETVLGERGSTLSGGQRQCVAIARALIRDAPIVLLDEPTVGLDNRSSGLVLAALDRLMEGRTVLIVSHQFEIISKADRIAVIQHGTKVDEGDTQSLLAREGLFRELHLSQIGNATS